MKITINVDCTPEEARTFMGLPDLKPIQDKLMQEMQDQMMAGLRSMDATEMLRAWMPSTKGFEQLQTMFSRMAAPGKE